MKSNNKGPNHYKRGTIQPWDFIRDQGLNYHLGNVIKYVCRAGYKDDAIDDLKKAIHYLENEVEHRTGTRVQECVFSTELTSTKESYDAEVFDR
tara:strand:- start:139 stop:420 length:282 start_codon:yes stop_codon:yes gene_type:complete